MAILVHVGALVVLLSIVASMLIQIYRVLGGWVPNIRSIAAIEAMDDGVARAAEMGGKVNFTTGSSSIYGKGSMGVFAGIAIMRYIAEECAKYNVPLIHTFGQAEVISISEQVLKSAGESAGRPEWFQEDYV
ncbi:unnamed protein product, partial [marine sediment metagenome]